MSPIVHAEVGWLCAQSLPRRRDRALVTAAAVALDLDGLTLVFGEGVYASWHHRLTHGALAAVLTLLILIAWTGSAKAAALGAAAFHSHVLLDLAGSGPGWPIFYFWPFANTAWLPAWQWDLASWQNALFGLVASVTCLLCALPLGRTPVELVSLSADARVVATVRARFGRATQPQPGALP